jgi:hypothetical protein
MSDSFDRSSYVRSGAVRFTQSGAIDRRCSAVRTGAITLNGDGSDESGPGNDDGSGELQYRTPPLRILDSPRKNGTEHQICPIEYQHSISRNSKHVVRLLMHWWLWCVCFRTSRPRPVGAPRKLTGTDRRSQSTL